MTLTKRQTWIALAVAAILFGFTLFQASWVASAPGGKPKLVATTTLDPIRGPGGCLADANVSYGRTAVGPDVASLQGAAGVGADMVAIRSELSGGSLLIARDYKSPCASDMARPRSTAAEALAGLSKPERLWRIEGAAQAQALVAALPESSEQDMVLGDTAAVKAIDAARPNLRAFTVVQARACASDYRTSGIWGGVPAACKGGAMLLTLDDLGYTLWGWPDRFLARMKAADVSVFVAAGVDGDKIRGLDDMRQYGEIAGSYNGYIWVDNIEELGFALKR